MSEKEEPVLDAEIVEDNTAVELSEGPPPVVPATDYTDAGVPNFDYVRDRIETRVGTTVGAAELAEATPAANTVEDKFAAREKAGRDKLEEIRRAMRENG
jgi:phage shock protein A